MGDAARVLPAACACTPIWQFLFIHISAVGSGRLVVNTSIPHSFHMLLHSVLTFSTLAIDLYLPFHVFSTPGTSDFRTYVFSVPIVVNALNSIYVRRRRYKRSQTLTQ